MSNLLALDPVHLIQAAGLIGVFIIIFAETGLLLGFFLPGDSLLLPIGILASQGYLNPWHFGIVIALAAIIGDSTGYIIGRKFGPRLFAKENSFFFDKKHIERTEQFYKKYGSITVLLARFTPIVRTFASPLAGVGNMRYQLFLFWNILGGILWPLALISLGYFFGNRIPNIERYIVPVVLGVVILFALPVVIQGIRHLVGMMKKH